MVNWENSVRIICDALRDLLSFVQFKKREKHPWRRVTFSKVAGFTKSRNASQMLNITKNIWLFFWISSNVNEVIKTILDFFIQNSFLNSPKKLVFVCIYGSTIIGVVGSPYPYCSLERFVLLLGCVFVLLVVFS